MCGMLLTYLKHCLSLLKIVPLELLLRQGKNLGERQVLVNGELRNKMFLIGAYQMTYIRLSTTMMVVDQVIV